jgi:hypothetical protein
MGAETTATATATLAANEASAPQPQPAPPGVRLLAGPLARWPEGLLEQLHQRGPVTVCQLESLHPGPADDDATDGLLLLGYAEPRSALAALLTPTLHDDNPVPDASGLDPVALLRDWQRASERMLQLQRQGGPGVLLVNLSRLEGPAQAALLRRLAKVGSGEAASPPEPDLDAQASPAADASELDSAAPPAAPSPPPLPAVVAHYLAQRPEIDQLLADLENCAELLGREPQLPTAAPPARGLVLAERLLDEWLESRTAQHEALARLRHDLELRQDELATTSGVLADVAGLQRQAEEEADRLRQAFAQQGQELEQTCQELERTRRQVAEEEARQRDGEEERELILLQLQQVQAELSHTFQEWNQARQELQERQQETQQAQLETQQARQELQQSQLELQQARQELQQALQGLEWLRNSTQQQAQRLASLEQECRTLFLNSQLNAQIDRTKIATILQLVRDDLRL